MRCLIGDTERTADLRPRKATPARAEHSHVETGAGRLAHLHQFSDLFSLTLILDPNPFGVVVLDNRESVCFGDRVLGRHPHHLGCIAPVGQPAIHEHWAAA